MSEALAGSVVDGKEEERQERLNQVTAQWVALRRVPFNVADGEEFENMVASGRLNSKV